MDNLRNRIERKIKYVKNDETKKKLGYVFEAIKGRNYQGVIETIILNGFAMVIELSEDKYRKYEVIDFFRPLLIDTFTTEAKNFHLKKYREL